MKRFILQDSNLCRLVFLLFICTSSLFAQEKNEDKDQAVEEMKSFTERSKTNQTGLSKLFISGYGATTLSVPEDSDSSFGAFFSPLFHYSLSEKMHFMAEVEFELEDGETEVALEIAALDYVISDNFTFVAGKMILPFNTFSERSHPVWINKLPTMPPIYGGHDGGGLVPVLFDVGFQVRGGVAIPLAKGSKINYAFYGVNGPSVNEGEHEEEVAEDAAVEEDDDLDFSFGKNYSDNNSNKAFGGRLGLLPIWNLELGVSYMTAAVDNEGDLDVTLFGLDAEYHLWGAAIKGEYINKKVDDETSSGFYFQISYRLSDFGNTDFSKFMSRVELVARYGEVDDDDNVLSTTTFGVNYLITPSFPVKLGYEIKEDKEDSLYLQIAFGF